MTKEQAIEVLHELDGSLYETQQVALDMAIKALEQPTTQEILSHIETGITATGQSDSVIAWMEVPDYIGKK